MLHDTPAACVQHKRLQATVRGVRVVGHKLLYSCLGACSSLSYVLVSTREALGDGAVMVSPPLIAGVVCQCVSS
jgi:hypothetical protein